MPTIERLIWVAWRAFWVGLGASLVLIAQAFVSPSPSVLPRAEVATATAPVPAVTCAGSSTSMGSAKSADPILSRNPFDSKTGPLTGAPAKRPRGA